MERENSLRARPGWRAAGPCFILLGLITLLLLPATARGGNPVAPLRFPHTRLRGRI